jgi:N utilization substance protein B
MTTESNNPNVAGKNTRRDARELALRMLYQLDIGHQPLEEVIDAALAQSHMDEKNQAFAQELVRGALSHKDVIDEKVTSLATDWALDRQAAVDRNILRLAAFELLYCPESPVAAVVNEAVELAKKYSTAESGRFVNGVLGALARQPRGGEEVATEVNEIALDEISEANSPGNFTQDEQ